MNTADPVHVWFCNSFLELKLMASVCLDLLNLKDLKFIETFFGD